MLYEVLKTAKMGAGKAPDLYTALLAKNLRRDGEVKTLSGAPPLSFQANGQPLLDYLISGNTVQSGTPTPENPVMPQGTGDLETSGTKAGQYKIPISSASTTTPVYLGEVQTTRKIKKLVLTGEENWIKSSAYKGSFYATIVANLLSEDYTAYCSHLTFTKLSQYAKGKFCFNGGTLKNCNLWFDQFDSSTTVADFKAYLAAQYAAGTPVTIWYVLATEETAVVNEPLMKIGDYADTLSKAQAGVEIPTARGTNTLDVLTDVKPSEVYIKYKS